MTDSDDQRKLRIFFSYTAEEGENWCAPFAKVLKARLENHGVAFEAVDWLENGAPLGIKLRDWSESKARASDVLIAFITKRYAEGISFDELLRFLEVTGDSGLFVPIFLHNSAWEAWTSKTGSDSKISERLRDAIKQRRHGKFFAEGRDRPILFKDDQGTRAKVLEEIYNLSDLIKDVALAHSPESVMPTERSQQDEGSPSAASAAERSPVVAVFGHPGGVLTGEAAGQRDELVRQLNEAASDKLISVADGWDQAGSAENVKALGDLQPTDGREVHLVQVLDDVLAEHWFGKGREAAAKFASARIEMALEMARSPGSKGPASISVTLWLPAEISHDGFETRARSQTEGQVLRHIPLGQMARELKSLIGAGSASDLAFLLQDPKQRERILWATSDFPKMVPLDAPDEENWWDSWYDADGLTKSLGRTAVDDHSVIVVAANDANVPETPGAGDQAVKKGLSEVLKDYERAIRQGLKLGHDGHRDRICRLAFVFLRSDELRSSYMVINNEIWSVLRLTKTDRGYELWEPGDLEGFRDRMEEARQNGTAHQG